MRPQLCFALFPFTSFIRPRGKTQSDLLQLLVPGLEVLELALQVLNLAFQGLKLLDFGLLQFAHEQFAAQRQSLGRVQRPFVQVDLLQGLLRTPFKTFGLFDSGLPAVASKVTQELPSFLQFDLFKYEFLFYLPQGFELLFYFLHQLVPRRQALLPQVQGCAQQLERVVELAEAQVGLCGGLHCHEQDEVLGRAFEQVDGLDAVRDGDAGPALFN